MHTGADPFGSDPKLEPLARHQSALRGLAYTGDLVYLIQFRSPIRTSLGARSLKPSLHYERKLPMVQLFSGTAGSRRQCVSNVPLQPATIAGSVFPMYRNCRRHICRRWPPAITAHWKPGFTGLKCLTTCQLYCLWIAFQ